MAGNADAVRAFQEIADLLDVLGEKFKPEAYRRAARSIESLTEGLSDVAARDQLREIPGVGQAIAEKIREYLQTGSIAYLEKLRREIPPGIVALMRISGIGPKTARRFWTDLGVDGPATLLAAIDAGKLEGLSGFGPKKIAKVRGALAATPSDSRRRPLREAARTAAEIVAHLRAGAPVDQIEVAGSLRRRRETVGDLDILVTSAEPERVLDRFAALPGISVVLRGPTKQTIRTADGLQVDLRVVPSESFGAAWQYFTGSKDHNILTRSLARDRGLKINEYAVMRGEERLPSATEAEIYQTLDLPWIPPEIREGQGEIEAARAGTLPKLLAPTDLVGELHLHIAPDDRPARWEEQVADAKAAGLHYVGFVATDLDRLAELRSWKENRTSSGPTVLVGWEAPISGTSTPPDTEADFQILRADGGTDTPEPARRATGRSWVGHFGVDPEEPHAAARLAAWVAWGLRTSSVLEVTSAPFAEGLDAVAARKFAQAGGRLVVSEGCVDADRALGLAVGTARRGWVGPGPVLNARAWLGSAADWPPPT